MVNFCGTSGGRTATTKESDRRMLRWEIDGDLTGSTVMLVVLDGSTLTRFPVAIEGTTETASTVAWFFDATYPAGSYAFQFEISRDDTFVNAPTIGFGTLVVEPDLG